MTSNLQTLAEKSQFRETGRTAEVATLCAEFERAWPDAVWTFEYGRSAEGRAMLAMVVSRSGVLTAEELKRRNIPLLMVQAGIHPGESDGKDAGFIALREMLEAGDALSQMAILFVPAFNTDGHERVGRWNRPNQNGPIDTGWRTTAQNINLNRDYCKAETPEMQAMLRLIAEWDPLVCADLHVTDGADFEPDVSIQVEPINQGAPSLRASGLELRNSLIAQLANAGSLPLPFYPDLVEPDNPLSGFVLTVYSPRFSTGYFPQRNRFTVLVETHSWKPYEQRVRVTRNTIFGLAALVGEHGPRWLDEAQRADAAAATSSGTQVELDFESAWREPLSTQPVSAAAPAPTQGAELIEFRGYAYTRTKSEISGGLITRYDPTTPQIWRVPYRNEVQASVTVRVPKGGYFVAPGHADLVASKLDLHGIAYRRLTAAFQPTEVEVFRADGARFSTAPFEGRMRVTLTGKWEAEEQGIPAGALFVPVAQPLVRLVLALLEPQAPDSFAAWGFFNAWFEQKEHLEGYVAEPLAREMLSADPQLAAEFQRQLAENPAFAASPAARLEFFHRRHASWDRQFNLYPIFRSENSPP